MCVNVKMPNGLLGPTPTRRRAIMLDPTFGSFTLLELVSLVKVFRPFRLERICFWVFRVCTRWVDVQHLIYWQGECVCDALLH